MENRSVKPTTAPGNIRFCYAGILFLFSTACFASGFQTSFHSVSSFTRGLGGAGVQGDDLADIYYNPAGIRLYTDGGVQGYLSSFKVESTFENQDSSQNLMGLTIPSRGSSQGISEALQTGSFQYVRRTSDNSGLSYGVFFGNAFGNKNTYDNGWVGRYHALSSELIVLDLNPTIGWDVSDTLSLGAGISIQASDTTLSQSLFLGPTARDGEVTVSGTDTAFGFNAGVMYKSPTGNTRLGASYRSSTDHNITGSRVINGTGLFDGAVDAEAQITFPETVYLSGRFSLAEDQRWVLSWVSRWTRWSRNDELRVSFADGSPDSVVAQNWDDVWLHGLGIEYKINDKVKLRGGITVDSTPIPSAELRTPRQPESDRTWFSIGASFTAKNGIIWDLGYQRQYIDSARINNTKTDLVSSAPGVFTDSLVGVYNDFTVDLIGIQVRKTFR